MPKAFFIMLLAACGWCSNGVASAAGPEPDEADVAAITAVTDAFAEAWNTGDMDAFAALFTADADWVNIRGNRWRGVDEIREQHAAIHRMFFQGSRLSFADVGIRMVAPDVAVVHARETVTGSNMPKGAGVTPESQMSLVVVRRGADWRIANGQNTNVASPAPGVAQ